MDKPTLEDLGKGARKLPCFSFVAFEAMELIDRGTSSAGAVAAKLSRDQSLSGRVLQIANSPFYGLSREIGSIKEACVILGMQTLRGVVVAAGLAGCMSETRQRRDARQSLWKHAVGTAAIAHVLADHCGQDKEVAFATGLLHDIGRTVVELCVPKLAAAVQAYQEAHKSSMCEAEIARLGFDHCRLGSHVAEQWHLPVEMQTAIARHHSPLDGEFSVLAGLICLSNELYGILDAELPADEQLQELDADVMNRLGLEVRTISALLPQLRETLAEAHAALGVLSP